MTDTKDCKECDGEGRWFDASHGATRKCNTCNGTGKQRSNLVEPGNAKRYDRAMKDVE